MASGWTTFLLAGLATATFELARLEWDGAPMGFALGTTGAYVGLALATHWLLQRFARPVTHHHPPAWAVLLLLLVVAAPAAVEHHFRSEWGAVQPLEDIMLSCFRNLVLGLAALARWPLCAGLSAMTSMFLVAFSASLTATRWSYLLIVLFAMAGMWWLTQAYWGRIAGYFPNRVQRRVPVRAATVAIGSVLLASITGASTWTANATTTALNGWFPTSGGTGNHDPFARGGVGDGDLLVRALQQAESVGAVDSDVFIESNIPSIYDVASETYGKPKKRKDEMSQRAVAISSENLLHLGKEPSQSERSEREFSTVRHRRQRRQRVLENGLSDAVMFVAGRTPLHLRVEVFDQFDGRVWSHSRDASDAMPMRIQNVGDQPWLLVAGRPERPMFRGTELHVLKIIGLETNRIPAPLHTTRLHIGHVDQLHMFARAEAGIVRLDRDSIPQFTVVHLESRVPDPQAIAVEPIVASPAGAAGHPCLALPATKTTQRTAELGRRWVGESPVGWSQIEAIVAQLRREYVLDRDVTVSGNTEDAVTEFLFTTRRGPDYLFASAAAIMLRSLGYPTRLASGFYVRPEGSHDCAGRFTPVYRDDMHVWAEVNIGGETWVTIEPTPGYELLAPRLSLTERLSNLAAAALAWLVDHRVLMGALACGGALAFFARRLLLEWIGVALWWFASAQTPQRKIAWTIWLLEWRAWLAGRARPMGRTLVDWYGKIAASAPDNAQRSLSSVLELSQRIFYAPHAQSALQSMPEPLAGNEVARVCRDAVRVWTAGRLKQNLSVNRAG
jgi:hypothetical protein